MTSHVVAKMRYAQSTLEALSEQARRLGPSNKTAIAEEARNLEQAVVEIGERASHGVRLA